MDRLFDLSRNDGIGIKYFFAIRNGADIKEIDRSFLDADTYAYLCVEFAIANEKYELINEVLSSSISELARKVIAIYRDLFLNPNESKMAIESLGDEVESLWEPFRVRLNFWHADALHLTGDIDLGQKVLKDLLNSNQPQRSCFQGELFSIVALCEYLAGHDRIAAHFHLQAKSILDQRPDAFMNIFNSSMALRTYLKLGDPNGFEIFSKHLDELLLVRPDRRYLLRQTGYRAMLLTILGDIEAAQEMWKKADEIYHMTVLPLERGQYCLLRSIGTSQSDDQNYEGWLAQAEVEFKSANFPGPYFAEWVLAKKLAPLLRLQVSFRPEKVGLNDVFHALIKSKGELDQIIAESSIHVSNYLRHGQSVLNSVLFGATHVDVVGPSLIATLIHKLEVSSRLGSRLPEFRLLPTFVKSLNRNEETTEDYVQLALRQVLGLDCAWDGKRFELLNHKESLIGRPDVKVLIELASQIQSHEIKIREMARATAFSEVAAKVAHDIRSPVSALNTLLKLVELSSEERQLFQMSVDRIDKIASDLLGKRKELANVTKVTSFSLLHAVQEILVEKEFEFLGKVKIDCQIDIDPQLESKLGAIDLPGFQRALSNLLNNSIQAAGNEVKLTITAQLIDHGSYSLELRDNGPGFPEEVLSKINKGNFDLEFSQSSKGNGLGIKQVFDFANQNGLKLEFSNCKIQGGAVAAFHWTK